MEVDHLLELFRQNVEKSQQNYDKKLDDLEKQRKNPKPDKNYKFIDIGLRPSIDEVFGAPPEEEVEMNRHSSLSVG